MTKVEQKRSKFLYIVLTVILSTIAVVGISAAFLLNYNTYAPNSPLVLDDGQNIYISTSLNEFSPRTLALCTNLVYIFNWPSGVNFWIIDNGFNGAFTMESDSSLRPANFWQGNRKAFDKDNRLAEPPLELGEKMQEALYVCGKHILTQYNCFEDW